MNSVIRVTPRDVVVVEGPDAEMYLHGQISQDVDDMPIGESRLSFLLEPKGKIESLFRITRSEHERYVLDTEVDHGELLMSSLGRFKLRSKIEFILSRWRMVAVLGQVDLSKAHNVEVVAASAWPGAGYTDLLGASPSLDLPECSSEEYERLRLAKGLPVIGREVELGGIPNETDLLDIAVSFGKGCYRGQELVERIDSRSGGRRLIRRVESEGALAPGDELRCEDTKVGEILSITNDAPYIGFARLRADVDVADGVEGVQVNVASIHDVGL
jgi:folate-binding protein YgfZ